jgi:hypothetical protein
MTTEEKQTKALPSIPITDKGELRGEVKRIVAQTPAIDIHTHLFAPQFGSMNLFGIDELLTYHYLVAETLRSAKVEPARFWEMSRPKQADAVWQTLFVENSPISEATRGVVLVLKSFGLDTRATDLSEAREFFAAQKIEAHLERILEIAGVSSVVMTNDPFDQEEVKTWDSDVPLDSRFQAALRMDRILNEWSATCRHLEAQGYNVQLDLSGNTVRELRRFLTKWVRRMKPVYMAVSLPDDFSYPDNGVRGRLIRDVVLPTSVEHDLPFALMIGVRRGVNPALKAAGDGLGLADMRAVQNLCAENPNARFLVTMLSRENQHELCVLARKFSNLMPFGCWWFLNNPSIVSEITRERIELLGPSFIPQHSDARVLEQLIYKWGHARRSIAEALSEAYESLLEDGRSVTPQEIERDVTRMFSGNFQGWVSPANRG